MGKGYSYGGNLSRCLDSSVLSYPHSTKLGVGKMYHWGPLELITSGETYLAVLLL